jgi:hypothetical protein
MAINSRDELVKALGANSQLFSTEKLSIGVTAAGQLFSYWLASGFPSVGNIPTTAEVCDDTFAGCIGPIIDAPSGNDNHLLQATLNCNQAGATVEVHDRLAHRGGLSMTSVVAQTVDLDLNALSISADRLGPSDYSDIMWWLEIFANGGATSVNATVNVTFNDGTSNNLSAISLGASPRRGRLYSLNARRQAADANKFIRDVNTVTLSATTGAVGNMGFSCTRRRTTVATLVANTGTIHDWAQLGAPTIENDACLQFIASTTASSGPIIRVTGSIGYN